MLFGRCGALSDIGLLIKDWRHGRLIPSQGIAKFQFHNKSKYPLVDTRVGFVGTQYLEIPDYGIKLGDIPADRGGTLPNVYAIQESDHEFAALP